MVMVSDLCLSSEFICFIGFFSKLMVSVEGCIADL